MCGDGQTAGAPEEALEHATALAAASERERALAALMGPGSRRRRITSVIRLRGERSLRDACGRDPATPIYGEAKPADARALIEDGVPVALLPFLPTRKVN
ncbi:MAG: hypothetical protein R3D59_18025 [Paracoccaceae bacterium]